MAYIDVALTSPDAMQIITDKISVKARRGLVLCGKLLTAVCNDIDFGLKDNSLIAFNEYLIEFRLKMRQFIVDSIQFGKNNVIPIHLVVYNPNRYYTRKHSSFFRIYASFD